MADQSEIWTPTEELAGLGLGDLALMDYQDLVPNLQKDLQLSAQDLAPGALLTPATWVQPTMLNSWVAGTNGTVDPAPMYLKDLMGFVHLRGFVTNGSNGLPAFQLPAGYRPAQQYFGAGVQGGGSAGGYVGIDVSGNVTPNMLIATTNGLHINVTPFLAER